MAEQICERGKALGKKSVLCERRERTGVKQRDKRGAVIPANPETSRLSVPSVLSDAT